MGGNVGEMHIAHIFQVIVLFFFLYMRGLEFIRMMCVRGGGELLVAADAAISCGKNKIK